jgi:hypothetical protein
MELDSKRPSRRPLARLRCGLAAGVGAVALAAAVPVSAWADQSNDNSSATSTGVGGLLVAPITGALQVNLACPANINVLGSQSASGGCEPGSQVNSSSSSTSVAGGPSAGVVGGPVVAPVTASGQVNVSCPANVNVLSYQSNSGNCAPGSQSNSNGAATHVSGGGDSAGPVVSPITAGAGVDVTCPVNVNVLSDQWSSGNCVAADSQTSTQGSEAVPSETSIGDTPGTFSSASTPAEMIASRVAGTAFTDTPGPPNTGAFTVAGVPAAFPALGLLVLAVLAAAATVARRLHQERPGA